MTLSISSSNRESLPHTIKSAGWAILYTITTIAMLALVLATAAIVSYFIVKSVMFAYKWAQVHSLHLLWAIPVTMATLITITCVAVISALSLMHVFIVPLNHTRKACFQNMQFHLHAANASPIETSLS